MSEKQSINPEAQRRAELTRYWSRYQHIIEGFIRSMVWDPHDREDVLQATAEFVATRFDEYDPDRSFANWAVGIARYRILELRNSKKRDRRVFGTAAMDKVVEAVEAVEEEVLPRKIALESCLKKLPGKHQSLINLRYNENMSPAAIAERVGGKANVITATLYRIRLALAKCIEAQLDAEEGGTHGK